MSLLWMPGGYVVLASVVQDCGIVECGAIPPPLPVRKLRLYWISLEPRARHTCEEFRKGIPFVSDRLPYSVFISD